jgi:hypothetical protein
MATDGELGRLLDPDALDAKVKEPRGRVSIVVPTAWLREGARLAVALPQKLRCDVCDGGGCDACARSGAYRLPDERPPLAITLPRVTDDILALRVQNPIAGETPTLLVVRVAAGIEPSAGTTYVGPNHDVPPRIPGMPPLPQIPRWVGTALLIALAAGLAVLARCVVG